MKPKHFLTLKDQSDRELTALFELAAQLKKRPGDYSEALKGRAVAFLFETPSPFARLSFELAVAQLGATVVDFGSEGIRFDQPGSVAHAGQILSRSVDAIVARLEAHKDLVELAKQGSIPVINARSDMLNPCQALADYFTLKEKRGNLEGLQITYIGAGGDVCHALLMGATALGLSMAVVTPKGHEPNALLVKSAVREANNKARPVPVLTSEALAAVSGTDVIYTDTWRAATDEAGLAAFKGYEVTPKLMRSAARNAVFMHALSAPWGEEVAREVIEGPQSVVLDQAENRRHVQKALLLRLLGAA